MSTSPKPVPVAGAAANIESPSQGRPFPYALVTSGATSRRTTTASPRDGAPGNSIDFDAFSLREAQARAQGREQGRAEARKIFDDQLAHERASLAAALQQFTRDRAAYFPKIEVEVVRLALSIARRILHREAQIDPLLLAAIVRIALEKIDGATSVELRVHPQNASDWRGYLSTYLQPSDMPEIIEDPSQPRDQCVLETAMGTTVVGLEVQLGEIERGLMDLLSARPEIVP